MNIKIRKLTKNAVTPRQAADGDAGYDMVATSCRRVGWFKYEYGTGIAMEIPKGYEGELRARSSCHKRGMVLSNGVGTIDSGYRGEIKAVYWRIPFVGKPYIVGERVCQILFKRVHRGEFREVDELAKSERGTGGYGSTGQGGAT